MADSISLNIDQIVTGVSGRADEKSGRGRQGRLEIDRRQPGHPGADQNANGGHQTILKPDKSESLKQRIHAMRIDRPDNGVNFYISAASSIESLGSSKAAS